MVGTLAGAAIGDSIDAEIARNNQLIEERIGRQMAGAVTIDDVLTLSQAHLSDEVIITHIQANGVARRPTPQDLIVLGRHGVSDGVLHALQTTLPPQPPTPPPEQAPARIVVEEYHYSPGPPWHFHPHHRHLRPRRSGIHWGVSFGN
jgi:hypothetical protein